MSAAFEKPEFRKMFMDYMAEVSDPAMRAETETYLQQLEKDAALPAGMKLVRAGGGPLHPTAAAADRAPSPFTGAPDPWIRAEGIHCGGREGVHQRVCQRRCGQACGGGAGVEGAQLHGRAAPRAPQGYAASIAHGAFVNV